MAMIEIDGSWGEGGGQILRTSLSLAAITGQPFRLNNIRAGRLKPGLAAQHVTAIRAVAVICKAQVQGDELGSMSLEFRPTCPPQGGNYTFDVTQAREGGSAGSVTLILQAILLPLAVAQGDSIVTLKGGTHVAWSPPVTYIEQVYLPLLQPLGVQAELELQAWGWYPRGGGEVELRVKGSNSPTPSPLRNFQLLERGNLRQIQGLAVVTELPAHIPQRMADRAQKLCKDANLKAQIQPLRAKGIAPGAGFFLTAVYEGSRAGFSALGRVKLPAEKVAEMAVKDLLQFHANGAPVDSFLGDQLLLPAALGSGTSEYRVAKVSQHLRTNAWTIAQFRLAEVVIAEDTKLITVRPTNI